MVNFKLAQLRFEKCLVRPSKRKLYFGNQLKDFWLFLEENIETLEDYKIFFNSDTDQFGLADYLYPFGYVCNTYDTFLATFRSMYMIIDEIIKEIESLENPVNIAGMSRFGIITKKAFGVSAPILKNLAKDIKKQTENRHPLALELWKTGIHEARIIAYLIDSPKAVTTEQMDLWVKDFDNWAICDGTCGHLFCKTEFAYQKAFEWVECEEEFIKRAGIVLMAWLAVHDKKADDAQISQFLAILENKSDDERNFIKKAVNWSLRQIGKRNLNLNKLAIETAKRIKAQNTKAARWIAADALRELTDEKTFDRIKKKSVVDYF